METYFRVMKIRLLISSIAFLFCLQLSAQKLKKVKESDENGNKVTYTVLASDRNIKHGEYTITYGSNTYVQGQYENNLMHGLWKYKYSYSYARLKDASNLNEYYEQGVLQWRSYGKGSIKVSEYFDPEGQLDSIYNTYGDLVRIERFLTEDIREIEKRSASTNQPFLKGQFRNGEQHGQWYYNNGDHKTLIVFDLGTTLGYTTFYANGIIKEHVEHNKNGQSHGLQYRLYPSGDSSVSSLYVNGELVGERRIWHSNGQLFLRGKTDGKRLIEFEQFDEEGNLISGKLVNGTGKLKVYALIDSFGFTRLSPKAEIEFKDGLYHGTYLDIEKDRSYTYQNGIYQTDDKEIENDTSYFNTYWLRPHRSSQMAGFTKYENYQDIFGRYLSSSIDYPESAMVNDAQGVVLVSFTVDRTGDLTDIEVVSETIGFGLEEEAVRVIKESGLFWLPALQNDQPVKVKFRIPVNFQLY